MIETMRSPVIEILKRGLKRTCPACGKSPVFERRFELYEACPACGLTIRAREPDTWFFMYVSTAGITGVFLLMMIFYSLPNPALGRLAIIALAVPAFFGTLSLRKSLAIALDYLLSGK